ncbi:MAG: GHKL domain-containing protein [candidate division WOR-3 bacterium]|nr:MAG: GHKL domain-containing protein [candidate division WOR-3 bacterium]
MGLFVYYDAYMGTKTRRYFPLAVILLLILSAFLAVGLVSGRRTMLDLMKEQARAFLSVVALTQENLIFAEARLEDEFIHRIISACNVLDADLTRSNVENVRQGFGFSSIAVFARKTEKRLVVSGTPVGMSTEIFTQRDPISFEYIDFGNKTLMRFVYVVAERVFQIELPADEIRGFRTEFGINRVITQIAANPMISYLVLQDKEGIIFATPNVEAISRIEDDPALATVAERLTEVNRIAQFDGEDVLELARPFVIEDELVGIFRIGISLDSYHTHVRKTEGQLIVLFVILFGAGFILFLLFMNYQSYSNIRELFQKTLGAIEDGVLLVSGNKRISAANEMFCKLSAFDDSLLVGNYYSKIFPDDPFETSKAMAEAKKVADEKKLFGKDLRYATYPLIDEKQNVTGVVIIIHDVTRIREFEKEREEAERLLFLGNLVANFAHEIKNPLNGLSIGTQRLLREFPNPDPDYLRIAGSLKKEIDALNKIVNDFLLLARPRMRETARFGLAGSLAEMKTSIEHQIEEYKIVLHWDVQNDVALTGNKSDFGRALLNIMLNAIEAVRDVEGRQREITVRLQKGDGTAKIIIADNGVGMDEEERKRVFSPYFSTKKSGTGLGLYIAQKIVKDHGGNIAIDSEKNKGTTFEISFSESAISAQEGGSDER